MKTLFALLLLIAIAANGFMRWIARDFTLTDGKRFSIMHLELPEDNAAVNKLISGFAPGTRQAVLKQLDADYIFMAGCYPAIMVLCLIAIRHITRINMLQKDLNKNPTGSAWKTILLALTMLQLLAWGLDVWENAQLETWMNEVVVNDNIDLLRARTFLKFGIGTGGFLTAAFVLLLTFYLPAKLIKLKLTSTLSRKKNINTNSLQK